MVYVRDTYDLSIDAEGLKLLLEIRNFLLAVKKAGPSDSAVNMDISEMREHALTLEQRLEGKFGIDKKRTGGDLSATKSKAKKKKSGNQPEDGQNDSPARHSTQASKSNQAASVWDTKSAKIADFGYEVRQRNSAVGPLQVSSSNKAS